MLLLASEKAKQWLISLVCKNANQSSGACHRSLQLLHLLKRNGWTIQPLHLPEDPINRWSTLAMGLAAAMRNGPMMPFGRNSLRSQGQCARFVAKLHQQLPQLTGVLQEGTGYGSLATVAEWHSRGVRTVLVPTNIEALAPNTGSWTHRSPNVAQRFAHERRWWAMADAVFTISIEEAWWLQLHGIEAEHLPYYPAPEREHQLRAIQEARAHRSTTAPKDCWLWLADFRNPANQAGAPLTLHWLQSCPNPPAELLIAGRDCGWLQQTHGHELPHYARLLGDVSDIQLDQLYASCAAQLIVHPATSGMLTRIVDAAIAGIPVVGNAMAFKGYRHCFAGNAVVAEPRPPVEEASVLLRVLRS